MFASPDFNCSTLHRVEKIVQIRGNVCGMSSNQGGGGGRGIYRVMGDGILFFMIFFIFSSTVKND
jgi:hypothetical protein